MKKGIRKILLFVLVAGILSLFAGRDSIQAQDSGDEKKAVQRIEELTLTSHILSKEEGMELQKLLSFVSGNIKDTSTLRKVGLMVTNKVVRDRGNLEFLLIELQKLTKARYSQETGHTVESSLKSCLDKLKKLRAEMEKQRPVFNKPGEPLNAGDYRMIIEKNSVFLTGDGDMATIQDLWSSIKSQTKEAYSLWDRKYGDLLAKLSGEKSRKPEDLLSSDELKFIKVFGRVKPYYHLFSGTLAEIVH